MLIVGLQTVAVAWVLARISEELDWRVAAVLRSGVEMLLAAGQEAVGRYVWHYGF